MKHHFFKNLTVSYLLFFGSIPLLNAQEASGNFTFQSDAPQTNIQATATSLFANDAHEYNISGNTNENIPFPIFILINFKLNKKPSKKYRYYLSRAYYFQEFSIPSDEVPQEYFMSVECLEDRVSNSNQLITTRIYEDGVLQVERYSGGTSTIIEDRTYISAFLPTGIKMEEY